MRISLVLAMSFAACTTTPSGTSGTTGADGTTGTGGGTTSGSCGPGAPQGPLVITDSNYGDGGFTGNWVSTVRGTPAVSIQTSQPVTLRNCAVSGPGNLVEADANPVSLTIENCTATGVNPAASATPLGSFVYGNTFSQLTVEHCNIQGVRFAVWVPGEQGPTPLSSFAFRYNTATDLSGQNSDGGTGFALDLSDHVAADVVAIQGSPAISSAEIAWNYVVEQPGQSAVDSAIDIYQSSGTAQSPLLIHDNFFMGGYEAVPTNDDATGTPYYGGVVSIDGVFGETLTEASGFISIYDNQIVNAGNIGVNLIDGHDLQAYGNRLVSTGILPGEWPDGGTVASQFSNGVTVWNQYANPLTIYFNDVAYDNLSGWMQASGPNLSLARADYYFPNCDAGCVGNQDWPNDPDDTDESNEKALWLGKVADAGVTIGPIACP